ncbi:MAG: aldehyde dehydrogenase [Bacteroidetes bacterium]|nr:aldehyde dehydrogenase [Bacteroidota bacterium]
MTESILNPVTIAKFDAKKLTEKQRAYFNSGKTLSVDFRLEQLKKLRQLIVDNETRILDALHKDLKKNHTEGYVTEVGFTLAELDHTIKGIKKWAKPKKVGTAMFHAVATSYIYSDPYGVVLIVGPWNYPFQLTIAPLIGAMAAGNCSIVKPSEIAGHTGKLVVELLNENFDEGYIKAIFGGVEESKALLDEKFDYIFFTGGTGIGKIFYQAAAKHLTPVTLELGGKSPCIVDKKIQLEYSSKRITWGKWTNAGQTCVAPDYLLVHKESKAKLIDKMKKHLKDFYGEDAQQSPDYGRIINHNHFKRLEKLLEKGNILVGGTTDEDDLYIAPTIIDNVSLEDPVMQDEIFGPILPIIEYSNTSEILELVNNHFGKPLALYVFSEDGDFVEEILTKTSSGGGCVNDTLMHLGNGNLPFGGVGDSGIGAYHGEYSFDTFSHKKSILKKSTLIDLAIRYAPFKNNLPILKNLMKYLG